MDIEINGEINTDTTVSAHLGRDVQVMVNNFEGTATSFHTPAQARELAAALLQAADEAEGVEPHKGTWRNAPAGRAGTRSTAANLRGDLPQNQEDEESER
ncbi:hypothetical protein [Streptomyces sp. NPDC057748]|uniref:hypothetical protein n=1 Tax=unclassified Streptomyces TaxID=2593676 RepID=UPI00368B4188